MNDHLLNDGVQADFRRAMRHMAASVCVVTSNDDGEWGGITATSVTSVCLEPAAVLVCINASSSIHTGLQPSTRFCVNLLHSAQAAQAGAFSGKRKGAERFSDGEWHTDSHGVPFLAGALANLFCTVDRIVPYGTHSIFIGRIAGVRAAAVAALTAPLVYHDGRFATAQTLAAAA